MNVDSFIMFPHLTMCNLIVFGIKTVKFQFGLVCLAVDLEVPGSAH